MYLFSGLFGLIMVTYLLEVNRAPFDLSEAESEIVSGYHVEYGGFFFGLYYLGEYLHLYFFSALIIIILFGGWEIHWNIIIYLYDIPYNSHNLISESFYIEKVKNFFNNLFIKD